MTEADTCRTYVVPKLHNAGWSDDQIREQVSFTDGRIIPLGKNHTRKEGKRADYVLRYRLDFPIAIVEAKVEFKKPGDGLQQAMEYAEILGLRFAYSTNGKGIVEHDYTTGQERTLEEFPSPEELWRRLRGELGLAKDKDVEDALFPFYREVGGKQPRYYQEIAINRAVQAVVKGQQRILLTMATGTGKTFVAFQIVWKLWKSRRKTKILYLADRNVLVDQAKDRDFTPLGDAVAKIQGSAIKSREVYFAIYQAIADREDQPGLFRNYPPDFFDLIIVDECHRGSAKDESNWRAILEYFEPATQIGMTATPKREANADTYDYFGDPIYTYSLRTGIDDGFLAPYRVQRVIPSVDATGWRPSPGELDRLGREIPDGWYGTKDFERFISLFNRTQAVAKHLAEYLKSTDRMAKTIVFCVDQDHAEDMRLAIAQENADLVKKYPHYVARVVSDEGAIGRGYLDEFSDPEEESPVILTTSQMLTTGVDAPTCKNVVLFKPINSIVDFKQIIGRGTRVREDFGKLWFTIIDYTGATALFADPEFDGDPIKKTKQKIDDSGNVVETEDDGTETKTPEEGTTEYPTGQSPLPPDTGKETPRKYYVDNVSVWVMGEQVFELDPEGHVLRTVEYTHFTSDQIRRIVPNAGHLKVEWTQAQRRTEIIAELAQRGVDFDTLAKVAHQPDADPLDLLMHVAFNAPLLTRRERAQALKSKRANFFKDYTPAAREVLEILLDKYADYGFNQLTDWSALLNIPPLSEKGTTLEIAARFGGANEMRQAVEKMQALLYAE
ncbi:MAG: DEAD/DEAH box helicase family protein [Chloroflexi bacterium]|nr:DEAD/DEAH box helicase family protein [Chloroflexota bacterium]